MNKKTLGIVTFCILSLLLWGLTAYLAEGMEASRDRRVFAYAAGFCALVLSAHTVLFALFGDRKERERDWLRSHGRRIDAVVTKVGRRGRRAAWRIKARGVDPRSGEELSFRSDILDANPGARFPLGSTIPVYLDPRNPKRYWVDAGIRTQYL